MKRRRIQPTRTEMASKDGKPTMTPNVVISAEEETVMRKAAHECPVPKPRGIIGKVLGFTNLEIEQPQSSKREEGPRTENRRQA